MSNLSFNIGKDLLNSGRFLITKWNRHAKLLKYRQVSLYIDILLKIQT